MAIALSVISVAFAAVGIWLTVRTVNRREQWVKWALATVIGLPVLYVASFGPACWLMNRGSLPIFPTAYPYWPLVVAANSAPPGVRKLVGRYSGNSPLGFKDMLTELALQYLDRGATLGVPTWLTPVPSFW